MWTSIVLCRQCEACSVTIDSLIDLLGSRNGLPDGLVPDGVVVLDVRVVVPEIVYQACGCSDGPIFYALARNRDVRRMVEAGWAVTHPSELP